MEYIALKIQVNFSHSLLKCGWLWVGDNLCLLWNYLVCFIPNRLLCCGAPMPIYIFSFLSKVSFGGNTKYLQEKDWLSWCKFDVLLGVTYANMLVATSDHWNVHLTSLHLPGFVWYGSLKAHWSYLRYIDMIQRARMSEVTLTFPDNDRYKIHCVTLLSNPFPFDQKEQDLE